MVTFLHKDVFKQPTHLDWTAQYSKKEMRHMLQGRMSCLWATRHSEAPMLVINIHQAGSATLELHTLSAMRSILDEWIANFRLAWQQSKE